MEKEDIEYIIDALQYVLNNDLKDRKEIEHMYSAVNNSINILEKQLDLYDVSNC